MTNPTGPTGPYQPYPYGPQQYPGYDPYAMGSAAPTACRVTGGTQMAIGALALLMAFCSLGINAMLSKGVFTPEQQQQLNEIAGSTQAIQKLLLLGAGCFGVPGLALAILGPFVWRGAKWAIISSVVVLSALLLLTILGTAAAATHGSAAAAGSACNNVIPMLIMGGLLGMLIWALRAIGRPAKPEPGYPQQWSQYYQQQPGAQLPPQPPAPGQAPPRDDGGLPPPPVPPAGA